MDDATKQRLGDDVPTMRDSHDRYFCLDDNWYFTTREGLVMGPYPSREHACIEVKNYIHFITQAGAGVVKLLTRERATLSIRDNTDAFPSLSMSEQLD